MKKDWKIKFSHKNLSIAKNYSLFHNNKLVFRYFIWNWLHLQLKYIYSKTNSSMKNYVTTSSSFQTARGGDTFRTFHRASLVFMAKRDKFEL